MISACQSSQRAMMKLVMLTWLRYRYQLSQLQLERRSARKKEDWERVRSLTEAIYILITGYPTDTAEKLMIEVPHPSPPDWRKAEFHVPRVYLTETSIHKLLAAIRAERKERSEHARSWLSSVTGLIGVLIGLRAIILGHR